MLRTTSPTSLLTILQLSINAADKNEVGRGENISNKTNLSNLFTAKKFIRADYLTLKNTKKGGNNPKKGGSNTKKSVKAAQGSNYLISGNKNLFSYLRHVFTQASIFQYFDPE